MDVIDVMFYNNDICFVCVSMLSTFLPEISAEYSTPLRALRSVSEQSPPASSQRIDITMSSRNVYTYTKHEKLHA